MMYSSAGILGIWGLGCVLLVGVSKCLDVGTDLSLWPCLGPTDPKDFGFFRRRHTSICAGFCAAAYVGWHAYALLLLPSAPHVLNARHALARDVRK